MHYFAFRLHIIFRLLLIIGLGYTAVYVLTQTHFWLVSFWVILAAIISVIELLRYIERSHRELENLVTAIHQGDFTNTYQPHWRKSGELLAHAYNKLVATYRELRQEKESNHQYLQNVVKHISVALIGLNQKNEVTLVNPAAKQLLKHPVIRHLTDIRSVDEDLYHRICQLEAGQRVMVKLVRNDRLMQLAVQASEFYLQGTYYKLISLQDLRRELEEQELASWQKLIRVLTHEIMNSVIPIANLSGIVRQTLLQTQQVATLQLQTLDEEDSHDLLESLKVIEDRSQGLANFVKAYRSLTQVAPPHFREVTVIDLVQRIHGLFATTFKEREIQWSQSISPETLTFTIDLELIEQVLINLVKNALEALEETAQPRITLSAYRTEANEGIIELSDNGSGISPEVTEHIFVPFYTTKPKGSGVGLSLSQQIMRLHRGTISVRPSPEEGATFVLHF
ncbi:sensor histidine kinase [Tunicatimonas pelagia]|uniref:sensor histidine kinase n=1 Tax=Tunicatimonas pelagia TaxID=931531 RepID=UPI0026657362|nr:ATP-binding protein [Tunicatimonas pelagia]WKN42558.1 ATP-binding protein [Tunicatimonas pelagia]